MDNKIFLVDYIDAEIIEEEDEYLFGCNSGDEETAYITGFLDALFRED